MVSTVGRLYNTDYARKCMRALKIMFLHWNQFLDRMPLMKNNFPVCGILYLTGIIQGVISKKADKLLED